jgi:hypothetical protein
MTRHASRSLVTAKMESVYGTDPTPTTVANAMLCRDVKHGYPSTPIERKLVKPTLGMLAQPITRRHATVEIELEMQSSGTPGTPPAWGPLLRACGFAQTITASTKVEYTPVSDAFESITVWFYADGVLHKQPGCRGTAKLTIPKNEIPIITVTLTGLYVNPADAALPGTVDFSAFKAPKATSFVNTPAFTLHSTPCVMRTLEIDMANTVAYRDLVGARDVHITGRTPKGQVSIEAGSVTTKDCMPPSAARCRRRSPSSTAPRPAGSSRSRPPRRRSSRSITPRRTAFSTTTWSSTSPRTPAMTSSSSSAAEAGRKGAAHVRLS